MILSDRTADVLGYLWVALGLGRLVEACGYGLLTLATAGGSLAWGLLSRGEE